MAKRAELATVTVPEFELPREQPVVPPAEFSVYDPAQYDNPDLEISPFVDDTMARWVNALDLAYDTLAMSVLAIGLVTIGVLLTVVPAARTSVSGTGGHPALLFRALVFFVVRALYVFSRAVPELVWAMVIIFVVKMLMTMLMMLMVAILARAALCALGLGLVAWHDKLPQGAFVFFIALRWLSGLVGTLILAVMTWETLKIPNTQSATGILYVAVICAFLGELTAQLLSVQTMFPV